MTGRSPPGQAVFRQCFMITTVDGDGGLPSISAILSFWSALLPSQSHCFSAPRSTHTKLLSHSRGPGATSKHNFTYSYLRKHARTGFFACFPPFLAGRIVVCPPPPEWGVSYYACHLGSRGGRYPPPRNRSQCQEPSSPVEVRHGWANHRVRGSVVTVRRVRGADHHRSYTFFTSVWKHDSQWHCVAWEPCAPRLVKNLSTMHDGLKLVRSVQNPGPGGTGGQPIPISIQLYLLMADNDPS